ncbi:hypothetical protein B0H14DRAFT_2825748 [Mycena olivaceomarginata]|nr:hypothetical protein B0H14DRAFT_2825748 [Mycena olivaceomarginata]
MPSESSFTFADQYAVASVACLVLLLTPILMIRALLLQGPDNRIDEALDDPDTRPKISDAFLDVSAQGGSPLWRDIMPVSLQQLNCCLRDPPKNASIDMSAPISAPAPALYAVGFLIAMPEPPPYPPLVSPSPDTSRLPNDANDHRFLQRLEIGIADVVVPSQ